MAQPIHPAFDQTTEALDAAQAFAKQIKGKTVVITGVNRGGIGYTTAEAFVRHHSYGIDFQGREKKYADLPDIQASQNAETLVIAGRNHARARSCA